MTYNSGTDSYQSDFLEPIFSTGFKCDVPYKIDRKKYQEIIERNGQHMRIADADVVSFNYDWYKGDDGEFLIYSFFVNPENSPEGSDDFYECFSFDSIDYRDKSLEKYLRFIVELMECVIGVDITSMEKLREKKDKEIKRSLAELKEIDGILLGTKGTNI